MKLPDPGPQAPVGGAPEGPWLAIGPHATAALALRLGPHQRIVEVPSLHRALMTLEKSTPRGCLADASCVEPRPRAGLEVLLEGLRGAPLWMLGPPLTEGTRRAADEIGVPLVTPAWAPSGDRPGPPPRPGGEDEVEAATPPLAPLSPEALLEGCVKRQGSVADLGAWIHDAFVGLSGAGRSSLLLGADGRTGYRLAHARGPHAHLVDEPAFSPDPRGCALRAAARARPRFGHGRTRRYGSSAYVVLPLVHGHGTVGVVCLTDLPEDRLPEPATRSRWWTLAADAAHFLHTARELELARRSALTDPKTRLPNARAFEAALHREHERVRRHGGAYGVLIFDIDHFKRVNEALTHPIADRVLFDVAQELEASFRDADVVSRWGGEEFAVLLTDLFRGRHGEAGGGADPADEVFRVADRARRRIRDHRTALPGERPPYSVTVSGGLALCPEDAEDPALLVEHAAHALRDAKGAGRDRVERYGHPRS